MTWKQIPAVFFLKVGGRLSTAATPDAAARDRGDPLRSGLSQRWQPRPGGCNE